MSLQIGKAIYHILSNDTDVVDRVQKKIYPLIADVDTTFPFIVYKRTGIAPADSKDRFVFDEDVFVDIVVASDKYNESIEIADLVRAALLKGSYDGIKDIELIDADEDYFEDTFIQNLTFKLQKEWHK